MTELLDQLKPIIQRALDEDLGDGDVTIPSQEISRYMRYTIHG